MGNAALAPWMPVGEREISPELRAEVLEVASLMVGDDEFYRTRVRSFSLWLQHRRDVDYSRTIWSRDEFVCVDSWSELRVLHDELAPLDRFYINVLDAGASLPIHQDTPHAGNLRHHLPILTNPGAIFFSSRAEAHFGVGQEFELDIMIPHGIRNEGDQPRVHLIWDTKLRAVV